MMTKLQIRTITYATIAGLQTMLLGLNEGVMTGRDWFQLIVSSVLAAAISVRALYDNAIDLPTTKAGMEAGVAEKPPASDGRADLSKAETKRVFPTG